MIISFCFPHVVDVSDPVSDSIFRRTLLGYYAGGMHANFKII